MAILDLKGDVVKHVIGTDVQAWDAGLDDIAALAVTKGNIIVPNGSNWIVLGVGANDTVLTAASGESSGVKWGSVAATAPFSDTTSIVQGSADPSKVIRFEVDGLTTATTRVITPPNADINLAGTNIANIFTVAQKINVNSATALVVEQDGIKDNTLVADTANGRVGFGTASPVGVFHAADGSSGTTFNSQYDNFAAESSGAINFALATPSNKSGAIAWHSNAGRNAAALSYNHSTSLLSLNTASGTVAITRGGYSRLYVGSTKVGIGNALTSPATRLHVLDDDAATNTVTNVLTLGHNSSGEPAANFGTGLVFQGESSTTADQDMGRLTYIWTTATHATRKARGTLTAFDTAERTCIQWEASGTAAMCGFFGTAPVTQRAKADYNNWAAFGDVVDALVALGLFDTA